MSIAISRKTLSSAAAFKAVAAAIAHGRAREKAVVAAAVDAGGDLIALLRADGAFSASMGIAATKPIPRRCSGSRPTNCRRRCSPIQSCLGHRESAQRRVVWRRAADLRRR